MKQRGNGKKDGGQRREGYYEKERGVTIHEGRSKAKV